MTVGRPGARTRVLRTARLSPHLTVAAVAARAGCHPSTAARHLRTAPWSRPRAAHDPICPPQLLAALALDADAAAVAWVAVRHPRCPAAALDRYADAVWGTWSHARVVAARPARPATLGRFVRHRCSVDPSERNASPVLLQRLASHASSDVRTETAANPNCPPVVLARLARDRAAEVRTAAAG